MFFRDSITGSVSARSLQHMKLDLNIRVLCCPNPKSAQPSTSNVIVSPCNVQETPMSGAWSLASPYLHRPPLSPEPQGPVTVGSWAPWL